MPSGDLPTDVANEIFVSLHRHRKATGRGVAKVDGIGYAIPELPSGRESFSPDASYYEGPRPVNSMRFIEGAPRFAAEVRSENDYGPAAEREIAAKRSDYFQAGTQVVWDVDPLAETITCYRATDPASPVVYRRGDVAAAVRGAHPGRCVGSWTRGRGPAAARALRQRSRLGLACACLATTACRRPLAFHTPRPGVATRAAGPSRPGARTPSR